MAAIVLKALLHSGNKVNKKPQWLNVEKISSFYLCDGDWLLGPGFIAEFIHSNNMFY